MATGTLPAGRGFTNPHPRGKPCARARARRPTRARFCPRARHPRAQQTRGHARARQHLQDCSSREGIRRHRPSGCCGTARRRRLTGMVGVADS
jgi:hypothetical protein